MRNLIEVLRFCFISPEALFLVSIISCSFFFPSMFVAVGTQFKVNSEVWKFMPSIPILLATASIKLAWNILAPLGGSSAKILYQWEGYWKLKYRVVASIVMCGMVAVCSIALWIFSKDLSELKIGTIFISSVAVAATVTFNQLLAAFKLRELMDL